ncbi:hypothetical protein [Paenibacillus rubinfantis]|uniref:hypothetical protein n=1 Tax=Paenibacillus rubinfantis TaxID=1720296 RepID=UPI001E3266B1|nr:hypothetical protein [Paenibacillus rubinfantis]
MRSEEANDMLDNNANWRELAFHHIPRMLIDEHEPFRPIRVGVTVLTETGPSPSFKRMLEVDHKRVGAVIEYAVYWDYDITHLYDLEHIWIFLSPQGTVVDCEASFHGGYLKGIAPGKTNVGTDGRISLYCQPGKHAYSPLRELFDLIPDLHQATGEHAGKDGVLEPDMLCGMYKTLPEADALAAEHLRGFRFDIAGTYMPFEWTPDMLVTWEELKREIPVRMRDLLKRLGEQKQLST